MSEIESTAASVMVPRELAEEIDAIVGEAARNSYVAEALRERVQRDKALKQRDRQSIALAGLRGALSAFDTPAWSTPALTSSWVHDLRHADRRTGDE